MQFCDAKTSSEWFLSICGRCDARGMAEDWRVEGIRVMYDPKSVGVELNVRGDERSSLPPVRSVSDGIICGCLPRTPNGKRCESNRQCGERGVLCTWDDGKDGDAGVNDFFHDVLGKTKGRSRPSLGKAARLLMAGRKRWGQKLCLTIW